LPDSLPSDVSSPCLRSHAERGNEGAPAYRVLVEILLIFAVFAIQGAWPVPDVNEPYYLGKAIHYWNPAWLSGDFFMESPDTHKVFYFTFGWLSLWLSPVALAWTGRILTWLLLAWAWRRLSVAVAPRPWFSVLTAALFACLMDRCHMAGEWVIGGVEAKGFAYVLVFLGLESLLCNRWNRALLLLGAASAFHVLVGGWAVAATGIAWLWLKKLRSTTTACGFASGATTGRGFMTDTPPLRSLWPGILVGFLLALPGLAPSLMLDWGVDLQTSRQAHQIYVFERLPHHLVLTGIRPDFILRLSLLWLFWLLLGQWSRRSQGSQRGRHSCLPEDQQERLSRLRAFVTGAVVITLIGVAIHALILIDRPLAADLLRYYWFRLTDVALPLGVALEGVALIAASPGNTATSRRCWLALAIFAAALHLGYRTIDRIFPLPPRSHRIADFEAWDEACRWVADSGRIAPDARFLTPRLAQTFKWYSNRSDVATWKDVPQSAETIVQWWDRIGEIYATGLLPPEPRWYEPLAKRGDERLERLAAKYQADYLIVERTDRLLDLKLEKVFGNRTYVIYRLR
jgi:hypothetical protein